MNMRFSLSSASLVVVLAIAVQRAQDLLSEVRRVPAQEWLAGYGVSDWPVDVLVGIPENWHRCDGARTMTIIGVRISETVN